MKKRILCILLCSFLVASLLPSISFADNHYQYPVIEAVADTFIRANYADTNYSKMDFLVVHAVEGHTGNDRMSFVEFDVSDYAYHIANARSIKFSICTGWETAPDLVFAVIPLSGRFKDLDLSTLTYTSARTVQSDGQSLITYGDDLIANGTALTAEGFYLASSEIDITDYCKAQTDGKLMLMLKGVTNGFTLLSMEDGGIRHRPRLTIEGDFTDTQNALYNAAETIASSFDGINITSDVVLPTQFDGLNVEWQSNNTDFIDSDGTIVYRPLFNEPNAPCSLSFKVTAPFMDGAEEERNITINVLNESSQSSELSKESDRVEYSFPEFSNDPDKKALLNIPLSGYNVGTFFSVYHNSQKLCDYTYDGIKTELILDVTSCASTISTQPFVVRGANFSSMNPTPALISKLTPSGADSVFELYNYDLGDLTRVTQDLNLPNIIGNNFVSWTSSNRDILANSGRVERHYSTDKTSHLRAVIRGTDVGYDIGFNVKVIRANTSVPNGKYRELKDPMYMSDEAFFGKWDEINLEWIIPPVLRYDDYPELFGVEASAKEGDYKNAKHELRAYYNSKPEDTIYKYTPSEYNLSAEAMLDYICGFYELEELQGQCFVGTEFAWHSIDLTHKGRLPANAVYGLIDADMDGSSLEIYSKEKNPEYAAYMSVTTENGITHKIPVVRDTFISAGENADTNYGNEEILYCREETRESDFPVCSDTKRPYFRFGNSSVYNNPRSITFNFYARTTGSTPQKVYLTKNSTLSTFEENDLTWHQNKGNYTEIEIYNYKKTGWLFNAYTDMVDTRWQVGQTYMGWFSRFNQVQWLMGAYLSTGNEDYAYSALEFALEQYTQQPHPRYSQALDSGWRMEHMIRLIYTAINSEHMTDDVFTALMKWTYSHYDQYIGQDTWSAAANQVNAVLANLARVCSFFPEFVPEDEWQTTKNILKNFYSGESAQIFNPDGSYVESCSNYMYGVIPEIAGVVRTVKARDGVDHPDYLYFEDCLLDLVTYYFGIAYSYGTTVPYGDGGRNGVAGIVKEQNDEFFNREDLRYIGSKGLEGTEPEYTSQIFPEKAVAMMRSSWSPDAICAFIDNVNGGSHSNLDDLMLDVSAFGKALLVDAGVGSYSPAVDFTSIQGRTEVHNTIMIDGQQQVLHNRYYQTKQPLSLVSNKGFDFTKASNTLAYPGFEMNRNVLLLKNKYIIVSDVIYNNTDTNEHNYAIYWHPDYNTNLTYDQTTGAVKTQHSGAPNVKIYVPDETPDIHYRWMQSIGGYGIVQSKSVRYSQDSADPVKTFDTVIYPQDADIDNDIKVFRLDIGCPKDVATSLKINIDRNVGSYYLSNEETPSLRTFDSYIFDGKMAYVEKDGNSKVSYIAFTQANEISDGEKLLVYSQTDLNDFSAIYGFDTLKLYGSQPLSGDVKVASDKAYTKVTYNDSPVDFTYADGYITTNGAPYVEGETVPVNPGSPSSPQRPSSPSLGGGGGGGSTGKDDETINSDANVPSDGNIPSDGNVPSDGNITSDGNPAFKVFDDCKDHWANDYISALCQEGIISGKTETEFVPDDSITRAEFAKLIVSVLGIELPEKYTKVFSDVSSDAWYAPYVNAAFREGIISGYEDSTFNPDKIVTRQEMAKMLCIASEIKALNSSDEASEFSDASSIAEWAKEYVSKASALGFFRGDEKGCFNPSSSATRAEAATVIYRFLDMTKSKGDETK